MIVYVFGNLDLDFDSIPCSILPRLKEKFPKIEWRTKDPNELDVYANDSLIIIDTVKGINKVDVIDATDISVNKKMITVHDFDLFFYLKLIKKIKKNIGIYIIGIPMFYNKDKAITEVSIFLSDLILKNEKHNSYKDHKLL